MGGEDGFLELGMLYMAREMACEDASHKTICKPG